MTTKRLARTPIEIPPLTIVRGEENAFSGGFSQRQRFTATEVRIDTYLFLELPKGSMFEACGYCGGTGVRTEYGHVHGGVCFHCTGSGTKSARHTMGTACTLVQTRVKERARRARARVREEERVAARHAEWARTHGTLVHDLETVRADLARFTHEDGASSTRRDARVHPLLEDLAMRTAYGTLSDKQVVLARKLLDDRARDLAERAARRAAYVPYGVVGEKVTFTGTVKTRRYIASERRDRSSSVLLIFTLESGAIVKTFTSARWAMECSEGDIFTVTAEVKEHEMFNDVGSTLVKRPRLARG